MFPRTTLPRTVFCNNMRENTPAPCIFLSPILIDICMLHIYIDPLRAVAQFLFISFPNI